jgi:hypothetical protein
MQSQRPDMAGDCVWMGYAGLEWVQSKLGLRKGERSAQPQPGTLAQISAARAIGGDPPSEKP